MDAKLMVDITTGVMEECSMLNSVNEREFQYFCEELEATFKEAAAGAPDLRSAIPTWQERAGLPEGTLAENCSGIEDDWQAEIADLRAALASAAPVAALTDDEITEVWESMPGSFLANFGYYLFARAIEARIIGGVK